LYRDGPSTIEPYDPRSYKSTGKILIDDDFDLLEGGSFEPSYRDKVLRRVEEIRTKAYFNEANVVEVESQIKYNLRAANTLWFGLTFEADSQFALLYPCLFLARRAILAAVLVFGADLGLLQVVLFFYSAFGMMVVLASRRVWKDDHVQTQHFVNEVVLLVLCFCIGL